MGSHLIALDISKTRTGAAIGAPGEAPTFHSIDGRDETTTGAIVKLGRWLIAATDPRKHAVTAIYYEAMLNPGAFMGEWNAERGKVDLRTNPATTIALAQMTGVVLFVADMRGLRCVPANLFTVRAAFLGHKSPEEPKRVAKAVCELIGWSPANEDEADAGAVFYWAAAQEDPRRALVVTPMQQMRAGGGPSAKRSGKVRVAKKPKALPMRLDADGVGHIAAADARGLFAKGNRR
jgi:hypothetical protein